MVCGLVPPPPYTLEFRPGARESTRASRHPDIQTSRHPEIQTFRDPEIQTFRDPDIQRSRDPDIQRSRDPEVHRSRDPEIQKSSRRIFPPQETYIYIYIYNYINIKPIEYISTKLHRTHRPHAKSMVHCGPGMGSADLTHGFNTYCLINLGCATLHRGENT